MIWLREFWLEELLTSTSWHIISQNSKGATYTTPSQTWVLNGTWAWMTAWVRNSVRPKSSKQARLLSVVSQTFMEQAPVKAALLWWCSLVRSCRVCHGWNTASHWTGLQNIVQHQILSQDCTHSYCQMQSFVKSETHQRDQNQCVGQPQVSRFYCQMRNIYKK